MNRPHITMYFWTLYMSTVGTLLMTSPAWLFEWVGLKNPGEGMWVRLSGMFFLILAYYCFRAARTNNFVFMQWTVTTRTWPIVFVTVFALLQMESPVIVLFGVIDLIAAYWTHHSLRKLMDVSAASRETLDRRRNLSA